jgi:excinuclease UvrABC nuclease subunit
MKKNDNDVCKTCTREKRNISKQKKNQLLATQEIPQYVYMMFNKKNKVVYVGQTENMDKRMQSHGIFIDDDDLYLNQSRYENTIIPVNHLSEIKSVKYAKVDNKYLSSVYEIQLIVKHMPIYNTQYKFNTSKLFDLPELEWKDFYTYKTFESRLKGVVRRIGNINYKELKQMAKNFDTRLEAINKLNEIYRLNEERMNKNSVK